MKLRLRELRKTSGLNQDELAELVGVTRRVVGGWERQDTQITLEDAVAVSKALGCTPNDLCGWYDEHPMEVSETRWVSHYDNELKSITDQMDEEGRQLLASNARWLLAEHPGETAEIRVDKTA